MPELVEPGLTIGDLPRDRRDEAIPILKESFEGIYRWHAKRTLRRVESARAAWIGAALAGVGLLERFDAEVAYVYYLFVGRAFRGRGIGGRLLDDAVGRFRADGASVVFAASEVENAPSRGLFHSRGFRDVARDEPAVRDGWLGAHGYRTRMMVVAGEVLMGLRLRPPGGP